MAKIWDKLKNFVNGEDYDDDYEYEDEYEEAEDDDDYEELPPIRPYRSSRTSAAVEETLSRNPARSTARGMAGTSGTGSMFGGAARQQTSRNSINLQQMQRPSHGTRAGSSQVMNINTNVMMQVIVATPKNMEEAGELCAHLKERKTIIVNLEGVEHETAQRISDFLCGANYALDGTIQLISGEIFVICPIDVEISSQLKEDLRTNALKLTYMSDRR